jgi:hypothetical protein
MYRNPTAEYFCEYLFSGIQTLLNPVIIRYGGAFRIKAIRFHETETGYAEYDGETSSESY